MTGRELYERARRKAQAKTPTDPQATTGRGTAGLNDPCATAVSGGVCGHSNCLHHKTSTGNVTWCTIMSGDGHGGGRVCSCRTFTPKEYRP